MHTAIGSFRDRDGADRAVDRLVQAGIPRHDVHVEHRDAHADDASTNSRWDGMEREVAVDEGAVKAFGNFFARLFGHGNATSQADAYSQHVDQGGFVVVVDAHGHSDATRAQSLLSELEASDLNLIDRQGQRPLRDIVAERGTMGNAGMMDRGSVPYESTGNNAANLERERAVASSGGVSSPSKQRDDLTQAPGLRYSDKDKPLGS